MTSDQIKTLQMQLNAKGANLKVDGILGPKTQAAMNQFSTSVASPAQGMTKQQIMDLQTQLNAQGAGLLVDGILGPKTTAAMNGAVTKALSANPDAQALVSQNDPESIVNAYMTGDWTNVNDITGMPFSREIQEEAVRNAEAALAPAFKAQEAYDTGVVDDTLAGKTAEYNRFLQTEAEDFQAEKGEQDQTAADQGVLFSGSRYQKLNDLKNKFDDRQAYQRDATGRAIGASAREYQYKYGDKAASRLSDYYKLGGNVFDPNVARKGVSRGTLSNVYSPNQYSFQGTAVNTNKANAQIRAASLLANRANKLVPYGYKNQF